MTTPQTKKDSTPHAWVWLIFFGLLGAYDLYTAWKTQLLPQALTGAAFILFAMCTYKHRGIFQFSNRAGDASQEKPGFVWKTMYYGAMLLMIIGFSMKQGWLKI